MQTYWAYLRTAFIIACGCAVSVGAVEFRVVPTSVTLPADVLARFTSVTPRVPEAERSVTLSWSGEATAPDLHVTLEVTPLLSYDQAGGPVTILERIHGSLETATETWQIQQANFGETYAQAHFNGVQRVLGLLLPLRFAFGKGATGTVVHGLLVVPCTLVDARLTCQAPRLAFSAIVRPHFPSEAAPEDVLPGLGASNASVSPDNPNDRPCCTDDNFVHCQCVSACGFGNDCPGPCTICAPNDCENCRLINCTGCG